MQDYPNTIPNEYRPLSAWAYFGYNILFAIPLVGFIMLIVFAFDSSNINRRNYARSFFCAYLVAIIILIVVLILTLVLGISLNSISNY
ncbi:MAG: ABC transporter permease [Clostridia bacterium]